MCEIAVLGSINMDLVSHVRDFAGPGETVSAQEFNEFPGGKGANQAVGIAKLGRKVQMFGMLGNDTFGTTLMKTLVESGVNVEYVVFQECYSGLANIVVDSRGENAIVVIPGANAKVDEEYVKDTLGSLRKVSVLLVQMEIPFSSLDFLLKHLSPSAPLVILDPAPPRDMRSISTQRINIVTPNIGELEALTGVKVGGETAIREAVSKLMEKTGINTVICKAGEDGSFLATDEGFKHFASHKVNVVDTTAAGDAFNAALAVGLADNKSLEDSVEYANAAAALSVTKLGAQPSMPNNEEVARIMRNGGMGTSHKF